MDKDIPKLLQKILDGEGAAADLILLCKDIVYENREEFFLVCETLRDKKALIEALIEDGYFDEESIEETSYYIEWKNQAETFIKEVDNFNSLYEEHMFIPKETRVKFFDKLIALIKEDNLPKVRASLIALTRLWLSN